MTVSTGDTIPVWSPKGSPGVYLRSPGEANFYSEKFERENELIIYFVFIPIVIVWISERLISRKIRKIKAQSKTKDFVN